MDDGYEQDAILALTFIDQTHYLRFTTYIPYAILYSIKSPTPIKFLSLRKRPLPSVYSYLRDESIDTSPTAHILVTGQRNASGINVYRYNPQKQTLQLIWSPEPRPLGSG